MKESKRWAGTPAHLVWSPILWHCKLSVTDVLLGTAQNLRRGKRGSQKEPFPGAFSTAVTKLTVPCTWLKMVTLSTTSRREVRVQTSHDAKESASSSPALAPSRIMRRRVVTRRLFALQGAARLFPRSEPPESGAFHRRASPISTTLFTERFYVYPSL